MRSPDKREEYPLHIYHPPATSREKLEPELPYFECRTYDKAGELIKTEMRMPGYLKSYKNRLKSFDRLFLNARDGPGGRGK
jgi:hypothetical protein